MSLKKTNKQILDKQYLEKIKLRNHNQFQVQQSQIQAQAQQKYSQPTYKKVQLLQTSKINNIQNNQKGLIGKNDLFLAQNKKSTHSEQENVQAYKIVQNLLNLESKWIEKQNQIKQFVWKLEKTLQERNMRIERCELQKQKLAYKLKQSQQQKAYTILRFNQIHQNFILLSKQKANQQISQNIRNEEKQNRNLKNQIYSKSLNDSDNGQNVNKQKGKIQMKNKLQIICEKQQTRQKGCQSKILKEEMKQLKNETSLVKDQIKEIRGQNRQVKEEVIKVRDDQKQIRDEGSQEEYTSYKPKNIEARIKNNSKKILEQDFANYPTKSQQQDCQQKQSDLRFSKKNRHLRITASTQATFNQKPRGSFIKKYVRPTAKEQIQESFFDIQQESNKNNSCKRSKTINFNRQQQINNDMLEIYGNNCYSSNQIQSKVENKDEQRQIVVNKNRQRQKVSINSEVLSLITGGCTNQNEAIQPLKNNKLKQSNEDYQLSQSLVSASQLNYSRLSYRKNDQIKQNQKQVKNQDLKQKQEKHRKTQVIQDTKKVNKHKKSPKNSKIRYQNSTVEQCNTYQLFANKTFGNGDLIDQEILTNQNPIEQQNKAYTTQNLKQQKYQENSKKKVTGMVSQSINQSFIYTQCKINIKQQKVPDQEAQRKTNKQIQPAFNIIVSSGQRNKLNNLKHDYNSSNSENTHFKKPQYFQNQESSEQTRVRQNRYQSQEQQNLYHEKKKLFVNPQTKYRSFHDTTCGNNFSLEKSALSEDRFMSLNFSSQLKKANSQLKCKNHGSTINTLDLEKIQFQNQILHSYNNALQKKVMSQSKTQKLMEKFKTQNNSLLNKINSRKSIF